jgi:hypothetical protein
MGATVRQTYLVEEMDGDEVIAERNIDAPSPFRAATMSTDRGITLRNWEMDWIRVTDEVGGRIYAYSFARSKSARPGLWQADTQTGPFGSEAGRRPLKGKPSTHSPD